MNGAKFPAKVETLRKSLSVQFFLGKSLRADIRRECGVSSSSGFRGEVCCTDMVHSISERLGELTLFPVLRVCFCFERSLLLFLHRLILIFLCKFRGGELQKSNG